MTPIGGDKGPILQHPRESVLVGFKRREPCKGLAFHFSSRGIVEGYHSLPESETLAFRAFYRCGGRFRTNGQAKKHS